MIYLTVSIDTECDKGPYWVVQKPIKFDGINIGIKEKLQPVFEKYNIKPTYMLSPEVMQNSSAVSYLNSILDIVELGTHLHGEFIDPGKKEDVDKTLEYQSEYDYQYEYSKIDNLTNLFVSRFNRRPTSFRAGRFALGKNTLSILEKLNYLVDSSVVPFDYKRIKKGKGITFIGASNQPYYPDENDFRAEGKHKILEVPVTAHNHFWQKRSQKFCLNYDPFNVYHSFICNSIFKANKKTKILRPTFSSLEEMISVAEKTIKEYDYINNNVFLNMMFHNVEAVEDCSPYYKTKNDVKELLVKLDTFYGYINRKYSIRSIGLSECVKYVNKF